MILDVEIIHDMLYCSNLPPLYAKTFFLIIQIEIENALICDDTTRRSFFVIVFRLPISFMTRHP